MTRSVQGPSSRRIPGFKSPPHPQIPKPWTVFLKPCKRSKPLSFLPVLIAIWCFLKNQLIFT